MSLAAVAVSLTVMSSPAGAGGKPRLFDAARIPPGLASGSDVVVREYVEVFEVVNPRRAVLKVRNVVTIMNSRGRHAASVVVFYDRFSTVDQLEGRLLDADGREVRRLNASDIEDYSAIQGFSLYEDNRVKRAEILYGEYPYTVSFEYTVSHDGILGFPSWWPQSDEGPVESTTFEIRSPRDLPVRYRAVGLDCEPLIFEKDGRTIHQWSQSGLPRFEMEPMGPSFQEQAPRLLTAPASFEIAGKPGDMSTWEEFGSWFGDLWQGRTRLPDADRSRVAEICSGAASDREKAQRLYEHLQSRTRYVSVQLGIGGWQPFEAEYVSQNGYGDCKALTNYMMAMLESAGITSYPAFVRAGRNEADVLADFSSNQFNHVILHVPDPADPLWLECTSQNAPFGQLGSFTEDRNVLVAMPGGGRIMRTPVTQSSDNRRVCQGKVVLSESGSGSMDVTLTMEGNQQSDVRGRLTTATPKERDEWLHSDVDLSSFTITASDFSGLESKTNDLTIRASLKVAELASVSGPRLFVRASLVNRWKTRLPVNASRRNPIRLPYAFVDLDTITFSVPRAYEVENLPRDVAIERPYGSYKASVVVEEGTLRYRRLLEITKRSLEVELYDDFRMFLDDVVKADQAQIVLVKRT
jgi:hypothetical protein